LDGEETFDDWEWSKFGGWATPYMKVKKQTNMNE